MKVSHTTVLTGLGIGVVVAVLGAQIVILERLETPPTSFAKGRDVRHAGREPFSQSASSPIDFRNVGAVDLSLLPADIADPTAAEDSNLVDTAVADLPGESTSLSLQPVSPGNLEDDVADADLSEGGSVESSSAPEAFAAPKDAAPINGKARDSEDLTRSIIAQELPSATDTERKVWVDELKGMPPRMIRDLLRLRRRISGDPSPKEGSTAARPKPVTPQTREPVLRALPSADITSNHPFPYALGDDTQECCSQIVATIRLARDVVLNNIANANTAGFKRSRVLLEDMPYRQIALSGQQDQQGKLAPIGIAVGHGVQVAGTQMDHSQGRLRQTGRPLDLAIIGEGLFQIQDGREILFTRTGRFTLNNDGEIVLLSAKRGRQIEPAITVPNDAIEVQISTEGIVAVRVPDTAALVQVGQIQLASFPNPSGLEQRGENLLAVTDASGQRLIGEAGCHGRGTIRHRFLEDSNVSLPDELAELKRLQTQLQAIRRAMAILSSSSRGEEIGVPDAVVNTPNPRQPL
jgi:flagellar basal-body rod protein FlgG